MLVNAVPKEVEKEEKLWFKKLVVEMKEEVNDKLEIYPAVPRPSTVEVKFPIVRPPAVAVEI